MLSQIYDYLRELILNPPLSPGGHGGGNVVVSAVQEEVDNNTVNSSSDPLILRYLPLLVLLTLFWPIFVTLIATIISASAWLFWLCIGATTGLVQLLYVIYNFFMISWDLAILVVLKTFSMLRSLSRRYYYKAIFATYKSMGIERKSRKGQLGSHHIRRRRKEWSQDVGRATNFKEFSEIEIYEPTPTTTASIGGSGGGDATTRKKKKKRPNLIRKSASAGIYNISTGTLRRRRRRKQSSSSSSSSQEDEGGQDNNTTTITQFSPALSPIRTIEESPVELGDSPMRKTHSCLELKGRQSSSTSKMSNLSSSSTSRLRGKPIRKIITSSHNKPWITPIKRTYSSSSLPNNNSSEHECFEDECDDDDDDEESSPTWQRIVRDDLGMEGSMLLTTLARLKEARVQAASHGTTDDPYSADDDNNNDDDNVNNEEDDDGLMLPNLSSLSRDDEEETDEQQQQQKKNERESSYHITASFTTSSSSPSSSAAAIPKRKKQWNEDYSSSLKTLLSGIVKRNHLSIEDWLIQDARSVAERGQHSLRKETRDAIDRYGEEVERCMDWIAHGPVYLGPTCGGVYGGEDNEVEEDMKTKQTKTPEDVIEKQREELSKRYTLVKRMKQNVGHTALMLSGGGAQTMYHLGSIKALVESGLYEHIHVISGTSGGSISAAMCAIKTPAELLTDICVRTVSTDYMLTGEQKEKNIRWFPTAFDMGKFFIKNRIVVDGDEFKRCCDFYFKDITFEEAYEMTRKHVCITVTASRATSGKGMQRLLLNHISTPNVTLASAVRASCAVPGFFTAATLMIKDSRGKEVPFEVDGVEWIDGSVQADIPVKRISTLFNVSNYVVCQTNFHGESMCYFLHIIIVLLCMLPMLMCLFFSTMQWFLSSISLIIQASTHYTGNCKLHEHA
jgi:predicted acylesterase/phospholipase RssA